MKKNLNLMLLNVITCLALVAGSLAGSGVYQQAQPPVVQAPVSAAASYIIQGPEQARLFELVAAYGGTVTSTLEIIDGVAATLPAGAADKIAAEAGVSRVTPNAEVKLSGSSQVVPNTDYPEVTGATVVWEAGAMGEGVSVAVLDTGIALDTHEKDREEHGRSETEKNSKIIAWKDFVDKTSAPVDPNGHGTHVAGIIANNEKGADGSYNGMAPAASLVGVRVLDKNGYGTYERIISGIQWIVTNAKKYNIRIINLSLNGVVSSPYWADPLDQAVTKAWSEGIVVIVAAGNNGPNPMSIGVPANNPYVITVGAFSDNKTVGDWSDDFITNFSSAGPTLDAFVKPDVIAPGAHIVSTLPITSLLGTTYLDNWVGSNYFSMSGTSQAAAVTTGIAALTISANKKLTPDQVKYRILATALPWVNPTTHQGLYSIWQQGAGRVNAVGAVFANIKGSANSGMKIKDDLKGKIHYEGYSYFDQATSTFKLQGQDGTNSYISWNGSYEAWTGTYGAWSDTYGAWSDTYGAWSDTYGAWSDSYGAWSDSYGAWSDSYGAWSDSYGAWSDSYGAWSDNYGAWSDSYGAWSDGYLDWAGGITSWTSSVPWISSKYADPNFTAAFKKGLAPDVQSASVSIEFWIDEP